MNLTNKSNIKGRTEIVLRDSSGNIKKLWAENSFGRFIRRNLGFDLQNNPLCGTWSDSVNRDNTITVVGHAAGNGRITNQGSYNAFVNLAIGVGTQGTPTTATALASESTTNGGGRGAATASQVTTTTTNDTSSLTKTWTFTGTLVLTEEGVFDSATASTGNMIAYQSFSAITVNSTDMLSVVHKLQS